MCTIALFRNVFPGYPIVVAANRGERLDRPSEGPDIRDWNHRIFAPKDLQRGGTWNGVNGYGVFAGLTNRLDVKSLPGKVSRGDLVMKALRYSSARDALTGLSSLLGTDFNGFNLVIADKKDLFLIRGDGKTIISWGFEPHGLLVVTNHGVGRVCFGSSERVQNVIHVFGRQATKCAEYGPSVENLRPLLDIHDNGRFGTCINEPEANYGTKSSSIIHLKSEAGTDWWQYFHRERTSPQRHICEEQFRFVKKYPIVGK